MENKKMKVAELFAGVGGFRCLEQPMGTFNENSTRFNGL